MRPTQRNEKELSERTALFFARRKGVHYFPRTARRDMPPAGGRGKGDILFRKREYPPFDPPRERFSHCKRAARRAAMLADCTAHSVALPRLKLLYDLPLLLSSAVAQPLAALLPYGCGTPLAGAALPILWKHSLISVYFGFVRSCCCLPRRHCCVRRVQVCFFFSPLL